MTPNNHRNLNKTVGLNRGLLLSYKEFLKFSTTLYSSATVQKRLPFCISSPILCAKTIWYRYLYLLCAVLFYFHLKNLLFFSNGAVKPLLSYKRLFFLQGLTTRPLFCHFAFYPSVEPRVYFLSLIHI